MKDATIEECNKCEHKAQIRNKMGMMFEVCNCAWLAMMDHHNGPGFKYPERWNKRK